MSVPCFLCNTSIMTAFSIVSGFLQSSGCHDHGISFSCASWQEQCLLPFLSNNLRLLWQLPMQSSPPRQDSQIWIRQLQQRESSHAKETCKERPEETGKEAKEIGETTKGSSCYGCCINWAWASPPGSTCHSTSNSAYCPGCPSSITDSWASCQQSSRTPACISCSVSNPKGNCLQKYARASSTPSSGKVWGVKWDRCEATRSNHTWATKCCERKACFSTFSCWKPTKTFHAATVGLTDTTCCTRSCCTCSTSCCWPTSRWYYHYRWHSSQCRCAAEWGGSQEKEKERENSTGESKSCSVHALHEAHPEPLGCIYGR